MKYLPFGPLINLVFIVAKFGGISLKGIVHLIPWLIKTIVLEPFRLIELIVYGKKIRCHKLKKDPVFILGHYRSGTTYLYRIFMQCPEYGYMTLLQSVIPELMLLLEKPLTYVLNILSRLLNLRNHFHRIPLSWNFPGEDDVGMTAMATPLGSQWGMMFPEKFNDHFEKTVSFKSASEKETEKWLQKYVYLVHKISIAAKGRQLILKSPPNTARIKTLLQAFPNARFIYIHRNPYHVYGSSLQFWDTILKNYVLGRTAHFSRHETILWQYDKMISAYLSQKDIIPAGRLKEVAYEELINNPIGTVETIFRDLGMDSFNANQEAIRQFVESQKTYRRLEHNINYPNGDEIADRWGPYFSKWGYHKPETNTNEKTTGGLSAIPDQVH